MSNPIFVFGSNLAGRHGAGAARQAHILFGAVYGQGVGHHGQSYAIPTKDEHIRTMPLNKIRPHIEAFLLYAAEHRDLRFQVTRIGCGLAGYADEQIAPMFRGASDNCAFDDAWQPILGAVGYRYWGHVG